MQVTFRAKLNGLFLLLMAVFMSLAALISFTVSKNVILRQMMTTNESELAVNVETLEKLTTKSEEKYRFFVDDFMQNFRGIDDVNLAALKDTFEFYPDLSTFLYSNKEFQAIFLYQKYLLLGTSLQHELIAYTGELAPDASQEEATDFLLQNLQNSWRFDGDGLNHQRLIVQKTDKGVYMAAVLNEQALLEMNGLKLSKLDGNGRVLFGGDWPLASVRLPQAGWNGQTVTSVQDGDIVSTLETVKGEWYAFVKSGDEADGRLHRIVVRLAWIGGVIYIGFTLLSLVLTRRMLRPIYDFIDRLRLVKGFEDREPLRSYMTTYEGHGTVYRKIFLYYGIIILPVMAMILLSFREFEGMTEADSRIDAMNLFQTTAQGIESDINAYDAYIQYLSLNREFQALAFAANRSKDVDGLDAKFAELLMRKGVVDKRLNYIAVYDAGHRLLYSSANRALPAEEEEQAWRNSKVEVIDVAERPLLRMKRSMRYLSSAADRSHAFEYLGDIEFGIEDVFTGSEGSSATAVMLKEAGGEPRLVERPVGVPDIGSLLQGFGAMGGETPGSAYIEGGGARQLLTMIPMQEGSWTLGFVMPVSWGAELYKIVLLYMLEMIGMLGVLVLASNLLGRRMTAPIRRAIRVMERYTDDQSIRLEGKERDFEFTVLAGKFNLMLERLEDVSDELRTKEEENAEMDKRIIKLLLKALQAQVNPHFLQNIFTSILLQLRQGKTQEAAEMLVATAKFLKTGLYGTKDLVPLGEEAEHVRHYIGIQNIRFDRQLICLLKIDDSDLNRKVPKFILQPLVENAIHHAMRKDRPLTIRIGGRRDGTDYVLMVADDGLGMSGDALEEAVESMNSQYQTAHYGLSNVHERIVLEYGPGYGLTLESRAGEGTTITARLGSEGEEPK
ncbi:histidine kinase [Paenibacillus sp. HB172176]|uniref:sensor histidine kinase n=1 Tax=Paenibacillus sp. HB172176 TaxID=2493690 RepID=UPI0014393266|nr:histidine kinase [Paenibacillus sp. HB172176]